ncbi:MAG: hypothetical protein ACOY7P_01305 [Pseudomonadota bacterium]
MFRRLYALRLVMLLLCLIGAQHVTLVHAFEHVPAAGVSLTAEDDGGPAHAPVCSDCLSAHSLTQLSVGAGSEPAVSDLSHVLRAASLRVAAHGAAPEPCAHGPPTPSPL